MIRIRMADLNIQIENQYSYTERLCRDYTATFDAPDLVVSVSDEDIEKFRNVLYTMNSDEVETWAKCLETRGIEIPQEIKEEILLILQ